MNMWYLVSRTGMIIYLTSKNEYTIGRKNCNITIKQDDSMSRVHAKLIVRDNHLYIYDHESRYGTYIKNEKISPKEEIEIKANSEIKFGIKSTIFRAKCYPINICVSKLEGAKKAEFISYVNYLNAPYSKEWCKESTHLVASSIKLTTKVLCALTCGQSIVNIDFWKNIVEAVKNNKALPDPKEYLPPINESLLSQNVSLKYKPERKTLFHNKIFIFLTKASLDSIVNVINTSGGKALLWEQADITNADLMTSDPQYVLVEENTKNYDINSQYSISFFDAIETLISKGKRSIPYQEIAMAVLFCSCNENCNPNFNRKHILNVNSQASTSASIVLAKDTQSQTQDLMDIRENVLNTQSSIAETEKSFKMLSTSEISETQYSVSESNNEKVTNTEPSISNETQKSNVTVLNPFQILEKKKSVGSSNITKISDLESTQGNPFAIIKKTSIDTSTIKKRLSEDNLENLSKKSKTETIANPFTLRESNRNHSANESSILTLRDSFDGKSPVSSTSSAKDHVLVKNPYGKRKAEDETDRSKKKTNKNQEITAENPFKKPLVSTLKQANSTLQSPNKKAAHDVTFESTTSKYSIKLETGNETTNSYETDNKQNITKNSRYLNMTVESINGSLISGTTGWISKEDRQPRIKRENEEISEDVLRYNKSFQNTIIVKIVDNLLVPERVKELDELNKAGNKKNFKKFKKHHPKHYQTYIIPPSAYVRVVCGVERVPLNESRSR